MQQEFGKVHRELPDPTRTEMKAIHKRLDRLEDRLIPPASAESPLVALLRERQKRNAAAEDRTYEEEPEEDLRGLSLVQVLQRGRLAHR